MGGLYFSSVPAAAHFPFLHIPLWQSLFSLHGAPVGIGEKQVPILPLGAIRQVNPLSQLSSLSQLSPCFRLWYPPEQLPGSAGRPSLGLNGLAPEQWEPGVGQSLSLLHITLPARLNLPGNRKNRRRKRRKRVFKTLNSFISQLFYFLNYFF
jgi:hypothetical protein